MGRVHHVSDLGPFTFLDASATCDAAGRRITVTVVNRDRDRAHAATVDLGGGGGHRRPRGDRGQWARRDGDQLPSSARDWWTRARAAWSAAGGDSTTSFPPIR